MNTSDEPKNSRRSVGEIHRAGSTPASLNLLDYYAELSHHDGRWRQGCFSTTDIRYEWIQSHIKRGWRLVRMWYDPT